METHQIQILDILRTALPGVEHFVQETLAFESLSDSARIEWAVLIQHLTKLQHNKLTLQECIAQIQSQQNEQDTSIPIQLNPTPGMFGVTTPDLSTDTGIHSASSSAIQKFDVSNLDIIVNEVDKAITNNTIVTDESLARLTFPELNPPCTDSANSEMSGDGNNEAFLEQYTMDAERQFCCSVCSKKFARKQHLRQHMIVHTGDKPYHCSFCVRKFIYPSLLREHLKLHINPPYQCTQCTQKFIHKKEFDKHMRTHLYGKPFECRDCGKYYRSRWLLKMHLDKFHTSTKLLTVETSLNSVMPSLTSDLQRQKIEPIIIQDLSI